MILTEYVVAVKGPRGNPGLFHLIYGSGQTPDTETTKVAVTDALRRAGMDVSAGVVLFDRSYLGWATLRRAVRGESLTLNALGVVDPIFAEHLAQHPDFRL